MMPKENDTDQLKDNSKNKPVASAYDLFVKGSLSIKPVQMDFCQTYLPKSLLAQVDLQQISTMNKSFVDDNLRQFHSDMIFKLPLKGQTTCCYHFVLFEHQSSPDQIMPFRILRYMIRLIDDVSKHNTSRHHKLPIVYPLIFYHGHPSPYPYGLDWWDAFDDQMGIMKMVFQSPVNIIDVHQLSDASISKAKAFSLLALLIKHIRDNDLKHYLPNLLQAVEDMMENHNDIVKYQNLMLSLTINLVSKEKGLEIMQHIDFNEYDFQPEPGSFADYYLSQGRQEGAKEKSITTAKILKKRGISLDLIIEATGLSEEVVQQL